MLSKIFAGLENLLSSEIETKDIFHKEETKGEVDTKAKPGPKVLTPEDILYFKEHECPVCARSFMHPTAKLRTAKYTHSDTDLRMYYDPIDPMYYDVIFCVHCGYAAIARNFKKISSKQELLIKEKISENFKPTEYPLVLSVDQAIERYKMALLSTVVKGGKDGEKAYLCLKLAWLHRDKKDEASEKEFMENALKGFTEAYQKETFPICGLEEHTLMYIMADLSRRLGDRESCLRYLGTLIVNKNVSPKLKDKALELKELVIKTTITKTK